MVAPIPKGVDAPTHPTLTQVIASMRAPWFELDAEEFALMLLALNEASLAGEPVEPLLWALVDVLRRQVEDVDLELCVCDREDDRTVLV